jgi:hypothetical protein
MSTGKEMWKADGVGPGSITYADGMLYCYCEGNLNRVVDKSYKTYKEYHNYSGGGMLALVEANPKGYKEVSKLMFNSEGKDPFFNHPVVIGGRLYLRHQNDLVVFDLKNK